MFRIIYPESKLVSAETIKGWFADALLDGDISLDPAEIGSLDPLAYQMEALEDAGLVTFAREDRNGTV